MKKYLAIKEYRDYGDTLIFEVLDVSDNEDLFFEGYEFPYKMISVKLGKLIAAITSRPLSKPFSYVDTDDVDTKSLGKHIGEKFKKSLNNKGQLEGYEKLTMPESWATFIEFESNEDLGLAIILNPDIFYGDDYENTYKGGYIFTNDQEF